MTSDNKHNSSNRIAGPTPEPFHLARRLWDALGDILRGRRVDQPCLLRSELLYRIFHTVDRNADYRINIVAKFYCTHDGGHAWLSRNNRPFPRREPSVARASLTLIGEAGRYRYYVKDDNLRHWYDNANPD